MSVEIVKNQGKFYVTAKIDNLPPEAKAPKGVSVECKDEAEAQLLAKEMTKAEAKMEAKVQAQIKEQIAQVGPVNLNEGAKKAGEGEKLDLKAA